MWPQLSDNDLQQVSNLILQLYSPQLDPSTAKALQHELQQIQSAPPAWGLVTGLATYEDPNVRFFSAHTAQVKISRDWDTLPAELQPELLKLLLQTLSTALTPPFVFQPANAVVVRKLFGALASLMIRLPFHQFANPIVTVLHTIEETAQQVSPLPPSAPGSGYNTPQGLGHGQRGGETVQRHRLWRLEWCGICVEEIGRAGISAQKRTAFQRHIQQDVPAVIQCITQGLQAQGPEAGAACRCAEAWVGFGIGGDELISLLQPLYALLPFPPACSAVSEILTESVFRFGKGTKVLTEPLVEWVNGPGQNISDPDEAAAYAKLLATLVEHSSDWIVERIEGPAVQSFLGTILRLTAWEGIGSVEENVSELTLPIYPLLQEAVMDSQHFQSEQTTPAWRTIKSFFAQLVQTIRGKVRWHTGMDKEDREAFETWRRDAGEVIVGAYYILRDDMLAELVQAAGQEVQKVQSQQGDWRDVEAVLHCIRYSAEAVPLGEDKSLPILFGQVLGQIGSEDRLRLTTVCLVQAYEEWFKFHPDYLLPVLSYLVPALTSSSSAIARYSADALKAICDMCRKKLVPHISAFSELHGKIGSLKPEEQVKVVQGITSVIQALDPDAAVGPVEGIVNPIIDRLEQAVREGDMEGLLHSMNALAACFKGLAPSEDEMFDTDESPKDITLARERLQGLRSRVEGAIMGVIGVWQGDGEVADAISTLVKASTTDHTLISLSPLPLLSLVCSAAERSSSPSSLWLSLASTLTLRINSPPSALTVKKDKTPQEEEQHKAEEAERWSVVADASTRLVIVADRAIGRAEGMKEHPDVVEAWFKFASAVATRYPGVLLRLDEGVVRAYVNIGVLGLGAQERFSLTGTCGFFIALLANTRYPSPLEPALSSLLSQFGPALLHALLLSAGSEGPRSVIPNLAELLSALVVRIPAGELAQWLQTILAPPDFPDPRATGESKLRLKETILRSRTAKKMREALNDFALVSRGLANTTYGNATIM